MSGPRQNLPVSAEAATARERAAAILENCILMFLLVADGVIK